MDIKKGMFGFVKKFFCTVIGALVLFAGFGLACASNSWFEIIGGAVITGFGFFILCFAVEAEDDYSVEKEGTMSNRAVELGIEKKTTTTKREAVLWISAVLIALGLMINMPVEETCTTKTCEEITYVKPRLWTYYDSRYDEDAELIYIEPELGRVY